MHTRRITHKGDLSYAGKLLGLLHKTLSVNTYNLSNLSGLEPELLMVFDSQ